MKHAILLSTAGILGAGALAISQLGAADPPETSTPAPQASAEKGSSVSGDPQKTCEYGGKFRDHGSRWGHRRGQGELQMLDRLLNLTDEQKQKVQEIVDAGKPKIKAIREEQRAKIQAVRDEMRQQIRPLLTPAQQKVLDDAQKLRESARKLKEDAKNLHQETGEQS